LGNTTLHSVCLHIIRFTLICLFMMYSSIHLFLPSPLHSLLSFPASCLLFLPASFLPFSQYKGQSTSLEKFQRIVRKIFNVESFPAKYDSALYLSEYDIANEFDVDNLRITLGLAHLVQKGIMSPLTQVYSAYKVGKIDEDAFSDFTKKLKSNSETNFLFEDEEYTSEDLVDINKKALDMVMIIADHIRSTAKRKWTTIDTISLSNKCACPPATIASFVGKFSIPSSLLISFPFKFFLVYSTTHTLLLMSLYFCYSFNICFYFRSFLFILRFIGF
jgi:hypothetical protein